MQLQLAVMIGVGVLIVAMAGALYIRDKQYVAAKEAYTAKEIEARAYEARLGEATQRAAALNKALDKLAGTERAVRQLRGKLDQRLQEVKANDAETRDWTGTAAPGAVSVLLRERRSRRSDEASISDSAGPPVPAVPAPAAGRGDERRPVGVGS